jgi:hypothetical protein
MPRNSRLDEQCSVEFKMTFSCNPDDNLPTPSLQKSKNIKHKFSYRYQKWLTNGKMAKVNKTHTKI